MSHRVDLLCSGMKRKVKTLNSERSPMGYLKSNNKKKLKPSFTQKDTIKKRMENKNQKSRTAKHKATQMSSLGNSNQIQISLHKHMQTKQYTTHPKNMT